MKQLKYYIFALSISLLSCGNNIRKTEAIINDDYSYVEQLDTDTEVSPVQEEVPKPKEKSSVPVSSSSSPQSSKSSPYDNMRGFDPASEDDIDDNGMSRYMENNDEEGWD